MSAHQLSTSLLNQPQKWVVQILGALLAAIAAFVLLHFAARLAPPSMTSPNSSSIEPRGIAGIDKGSFLPASVSGAPALAAMVAADKLASAQAEFLSEATKREGAEWAHLGAAERAARRAELKASMLGAR